MGKPAYDAELTGIYALIGDGKIYAAADVPIMPYPWHGDRMLRIDPATQTAETAYDRPEQDRTQLPGASTGRLAGRDWDSRSGHPFWACPHSFGGGPPS
jgi:hypothetical protein